MDYVVGVPWPGSYVVEYRWSNDGHFLRIARAQAANKLALIVKSGDESRGDYEFVIGKELMYLF